MVTFTAWASGENIYGVFVTLKTDTCCARCLFNLIKRDLYICLTTSSSFRFLFKPLNPSDRPLCVLFIVSVLSFSACISLSSCLHQVWWPHLRAFGPQRSSNKQSCLLWWQEPQGQTHIWDSSPPSSATPLSTSNLPVFSPKYSTCFVSSLIRELTLLSHVT